jgi:hypothetical protein
VDKLNTKRVKELRDTLQRCLDHKVSEIASWVDDGYDVTIGNGSFNDDEVTFKLNVKIKGSKTQAQKDLEIYGGMDNLDLTKIAKLDGKDFSLSGFRRKARTKPYLIQDLKNGGEYIITTEVAKKYFGKGEVA